MKKPQGKLKLRTPSTSTKGNLERETITRLDNIYDVCIRFCVLLKYNLVLYFTIM